MLTICTALSTLGGCTATRWYLHRTSRRDADYCGACVRLTGLWNHGGAFGLPMPKSRQTANLATSAVVGGVCGAVWHHRKKSPIGTGLLIGGAYSNYLERLLHDRVYDYVQFPKAPGRLKRYVFNLADFAILIGGGLVLLKKDRA